MNTFKNIPTRTRGRTMLGGNKPQMIPGGIEIMVNYKTARKSGYYETTGGRRTLFRRIQLPEWLEVSPEKGSLLERIQNGCVKIPAAHKHSRQGHIYWSGRKLGFKSATVGIDTSVYHDWLLAASCEEVIFVVYQFGEQEVERWRVSRNQFVRSAKRVTTSSTFEPQYMVALADLKVGGSTASQSINNPFEALDGIDLVACA